MALEPGDRFWLRGRYVEFAGTAHGNVCCVANVTSKHWHRGYYRSSRSMSGGHHVYAPLEQLTEVYAPPPRRKLLCVDNVTFPFTPAHNLLLFATCSAELAPSLRALNRDMYGAVQKWIEHSVAAMLKKAPGFLKELVDFDAATRLRTKLGRRLDARTVAWLEHALPLLRLGPRVHREHQATLERCVDECVLNALLTPKADLRAVKALNMLPYTLVFTDAEEPQLDGDNVRVIDNAREARLLDFSHLRHYPMKKLRQAFLDVPQGKRVKDLVPDFGLMVQTCSQESLLSLVAARGDSVELVRELMRHEEATTHVALRALKHCCLPDSAAHDQVVQALCEFVSPTQRIGVLKSAVRAGHVHFLELGCLWWEPRDLYEILLYLLEARAEGVARAQQIALRTSYFARRCWDTRAMVACLRALADMHALGRTGVVHDILGDACIVLTGLYTAMDARVVQEAVLNVQDTLAITRQQALVAAAEWYGYARRPDNAPTAFHRAETVDTGLHNAPITATLIDRAFAAANLCAREAADV